MLFRSDTVDDEWLYNTRLELKEVGNMPLDIGIFSARREFYDNWFNVRDGLYAYDFGVDANYAYRKWDFNAVLKTAILTDGNYNLDFLLNTKYRLIETPIFELGLGPNVGYLDYKYEKPTYWSPQDFQRLGFSVVGRNYICRDPEVWNSPLTYIDYGYMISVDSNSGLSHKFYLGFNRDFSSRLSLFARADFIKENYYTEFKLFGGLEYKFGGCE